jgi:hypothetical protein
VGTVNGGDRAAMTLEPVDFLGLVQNVVFLIENAEFYRCASKGERHRLAAGGSKRAARGVTQL